MLILPRAVWLHSRCDRVEVEGTAFAEPKQIKNAERHRETPGEGNTSWGDLSSSPGLASPAAMILFSRKDGAIMQHAMA